MMSVRLSTTNGRFGRVRSSFPPQVTGVCGSAWQAEDGARLELVLNGSDLKLKAGNVEGLRLWQLHLLTYGTPALKANQASSKQPPTGTDPNTIQPSPNSGGLLELWQRFTQRKSPTD